MERARRRDVEQVGHPQHAKAAASLADRCRHLAQRVRTSATSGCRWLAVATNDVDYDNVVEAAEKVQTTSLLMRILDEAASRVGASD